MKAWQHFCTITHHRWLVRQGCFKIGLYWQGLTHDLSKYSAVEFRTGARYYQGDKSPNSAERRDKGYSEAWMHHKGRNRHHFEYWTDLSPVTRNYDAVEMPRKFLAEMVMDRIAACKTYQGEKYNDASALAYLLSSREKDLMHPTTRKQLEFLLTMLKEQGEKETFHYIKYHLLRGTPFPWEEKAED